MMTSAGAALRSRVVLTNSMIADVVAAAPNGLRPRSITDICAGQQPDNRLRNDPAGGAKVALTLAVDGTNVPSAAGMHTCDKSVFQASVEVLRADPVGFRATLIGSIEGSF